MVSIISGSGANTEDKTQQVLANLNEQETTLMRQALAYGAELALNQTLETGQPALSHMLATAAELANLNTDVATRITGFIAPIFLFAHTQEPPPPPRFGQDTNLLLNNLNQLFKLRSILHGGQFRQTAANATALWANQIEVLRKMLLAMASDVRVVLIRLCGQLQTLRYFAAISDIKTQQGPLWPMAQLHAQETLDLYAPLANRLGLWRIKWELEDLSFRLLQPRIYKNIARMIDEKRTQREHFIVQAVADLRQKLTEQNIVADVTGRPKHIYSIYNKMQGKNLKFDELYDVRACRIIVEDVKTCYQALSLVHTLGTPVAEEFDDYIAKPKHNGYQSLHTVIQDSAGRSLEIQIRTRDMHEFAEYGMAAHWLYKELGPAAYSGHNHPQNQTEQRMAWLRQLLDWKSVVTNTIVASSAWSERLRNVTLDDNIYVFTPQGRVIELPKGSTPLDFAYHVHTDIGHKCRGAKVDNTMVPLNHTLQNGQTIEIITARGDQPKHPSRDWLNPSLGYLASTRARTKVRHWFAQQELKETLERGKTQVERELQRIGQTNQAHDNLAQLLGFNDPEALYSALARDEIKARTIEHALNHNEPNTTTEHNPEQIITNTRRKRADHAANESDVLVVGVDALLTQLAKCCRPLPPDPIVGFVTRGKGISIHRVGCPNLTEVAKLQPERLIETTWGNQQSGIYMADIIVQANDRQGLLKDITEVFARQRTNVVGVKTVSRKAQAHMQFTVEIHHAQQLQQLVNELQDIKGVFTVRRR